MFNILARSIGNVLGDDSKESVDLIKDNLKYAYEKGRKDKAREISRALNEN